MEKGTVGGWVVLACSNGGSAHEGVRDMVVVKVKRRKEVWFLLGVERREEEDGDDD